MKTSMPSLILRAEGAVLLIASIVMYAREDASWILFAVAFFAPDLSMLGYMKGEREGAGLYNLVHSTAIPLLLAVTGFVADQPMMLAIGLIWLGHIGLDRLLGYGLKYPEGFKETHLARV